MRVFTVNAGVTLNLNRLTAANGDAAGGGGIANAGTLTVSNSTFSGNNAVGDGGGILNYGGTLTVNNSPFSGTAASTATNAPFPRFAPATPSAGCRPISPIC